MEALNNFAVNKKPQNWSAALFIAIPLSWPELNRLMCSIRRRADPRPQCTLSSCQCAHPARIPFLFHSRHICLFPRILLIFERSPDSFCSISGNYCCVKSPYCARYCISLLAGLGLKKNKTVSPEGIDGRTLRWLWQVEKQSR